MSESANEDASGGVTVGSSQPIKAATIIIINILFIVKIAS